MNQEQLFDSYRRLSDATHNPGSSKATQRSARKDAVLAELETAHLIMYQQRAERALQTELDRRTQEKNDKSKSKESYNKIRTSEDNYIHKTLNLSYLPKESYDIRAFSKPKPEGEIVTAQKQMAFNAAQSTVQHDQGLARFRRKLEKLEAKGDESTLESLLDAAHHISVTEPTSAKEFLSTMEAIPEEDNVTYATVVSHLFKGQTDPMGGNPLACRLSQIQPKSPRINLGEENFFFDKKSKREENLSLINIMSKENTNKIENNYSLSHTYHDSLVYNTKDSGETNSPSPQLDMESLLSATRDGKFKIQYDFSGGYAIPLGIAHANEKQLFFSELQEVYKRVDAKEARKWLEQVEAFLDEDWGLGKDFAVRSRPSFVVYQNDFGWNLDQFVDDYRTMGDKVFELAYFSTAFAGLGDERRRDVARHLINTASRAEIKELTGNKLPKEEVALIGERLPEETAPHEIITAIKRTADAYAQCSQNRVNNEFVTSRLQKVQKAESLDEYLRAVEKVSEETDRYIEFANEQRADPHMNLGFNDVQAQDALELYEAFLGKNFDQFRRDFAETGTAFQRLPGIKSLYERQLPEDKLKAVMNYIAKQKRRDLINDLSENTATIDLIRDTVARLDDKTGKREMVKAFVELNKTYNLLVNIGASEILAHRLRTVEEASGYDQVIKAISGSRKECYTAVTGDIEVPEGLEDMVDNIVVAYYKNTGTSQGVNIKPALELITSNYLQHGAEATSHMIRDLEPNKTLRKRLTKRGVNIEAFEKGIERTYHVGTDEGSLARLRERIDAEVEQVYDRLGQLELEEGVLETLHEGSLREQLDSVEKFVSAYEFDDETKALKPEIKGHIQTARSMTGSIKEMHTDAKFYVSQDPFEALHMGQYFGSCLSLAKTHGGINGWASVVQTMDSNKNVIYARAEDGRYLGRNRTALTDQGTLCTRFYQNGDMNLNDAWIDYLESFADHTKEDVMIPTRFTPTSMERLLERKVREGTVTKEERIVKIEPAYFSNFYGDGVPTVKLKDGSIEVNTKVYVLGPQ